MLFSLNELRFFENKIRIWKKKDSINPGKRVIKSPQCAHVQPHHRIFKDLQSFIRRGLKKETFLQIWVLDLLLESAERGTRGNKFSSAVEKVQKLQWQAGKSISKMNPEHNNWSLRSCSWVPGALWTGAGGWTRGGAEGCISRWRRQGWTDYSLPT